MSDNDCVSRERLKSEVLTYVRSTDNPTVNDVLGIITDLPAVPHEMSAKEFFPKWFEICNTYLPDDCYHCPLYLHRNSRKFTPPCMHLMMTDAEQVISIVERWAQEHPERSE